MGELVRDRYEPLRALGGSAGSEVWLAVDRQHNRHVVLKVRTVSHTDREHVLTEARALLGLAPHPSLPVVRDDFFDGDRHYLVIDWVDGTDLQDVLIHRGDPGLPFPTAIEYISQIADALDHLHAHVPPVVHRDVKPANAILTPARKVVLVNFGVAARAGTAAPPAGSAGYLAPEVAAGGGATTASDVYSLAATAHALLTGRPPAGPPGWDELPESALAPLERDLRAALSTDPTRRPATARELVERVRGRSAELPQGLVTFVFTDVEGSTRLWAEHTEAMRESLRRHDAIVDDVVRKHGGALVKSRGEGDSTFAVFGRTTDAAQAAVDLQLGLARENWAVPGGIRIRVGIHSGEADLRDSSYYGPVVNRCARLRSAAVGGQVLLSEAVAAVLSDSLPDGMTMLDLGLHRLKDLSKPERIWQLCHEHLPQDFVPLATLDARPNNLPVQLTSYIRAEEDLRWLSEALSRTRLLTVTGFGGAGKTRLALQVAADAVADCPDGVWYAELASVRDEALVWRTIASALGVQETGGHETEDLVLEYLRGGRFLLVLDNCEHLIQTCAAVAERVLRACPDGRILATSREALRVAGESLWPVPPMRLPLAVALFCDRASKVKPDFALGAEDQACVERICRRLDSNPLALELAAARAASLSVTQIEERLRDRFRLLKTRTRSVLPQQQTLRAAVDWSHELLAPDEQVLFRRLGVFVGGFDLESAEHVCADDVIDELDIVDLLGNLVSKSMLSLEEQRGQTRYRLLQTLHQYAVEKLADEPADIRRAHASWFAEYAARAEFSGRQQKAWLARLECDHDNMRAAMDWALENDERVAVRLAAHLATFWRIGGFLQEGCERLTRALERVPDPGGTRLSMLVGLASLTRERGDLEQAAALAASGVALGRSLKAGTQTSMALCIAGEVHLALGEMGAARACLEESVGLARSSGDAVALIDALHASAYVIRRSDVAAAYAVLEEALSRARSQEDGLRTAAILHTLALCASAEGEFARARDLYEEVATAADEAHDRRLRSNTLNNLGALARRQGDYNAASTHYTESLSLARELGATLQVAKVLNNLGTVAHMRGDLEKAWTLYGECLEIVRARGDRDAMAGAIANLGQVASQQEDYEAARALFKESLSISKATEDHATSAGILGSLAEIALAQGDAPGACAMLDEGLNLARRSGDKTVLVFVLRTQAAAQYEIGDEQRMRAALEEGLAIARDLGDRHGVASFVEQLAAVERTSGRDEHALRMIGAADALREQIGAPRSSAEDRSVAAIVTYCRDRVAPDAFDRAHAAGYALSIEDVVKQAMEHSIESQVSAHRPDLDEIRRLAVIAEYRDDDTGLHIVRVGTYAARLGREAGMDETECDRLLHAAQMHDVGKIGVPDAVLLKVGKLDEAEWAIMRKHPEIGRDMLKDSPSRLMRAAEEIAWTHHERWDGSGYPRGLRGEQIPLGGRVVAVCDVFDALTSHRPYRSPMEPDQVLAELQRCRRTHFEPALVDLFVAIFDDIIRIKASLQAGADVG